MKNIRSIVSSSLRPRLDISTLLYRTSPFDNTTTIPDNYNILPRDSQANNRTVCATMTTFIMPTAPTTQTITPPSQTAYNVSPTHYTHGPSLAQPSQPKNQAQYQQYFTSHAAPVSPLTSNTTSPHNASPTSPRTVFSSQPTSTQQQGSAPLQQQHLVRNLQLRPPKSPLYVPAVLRPTEPPRGKRIVKPSPLTPPRSAGSSFDDLNGQGLERQNSDAKRPLSRRSTVDSGKWIAEKGKEVTRSHWLVSLRLFSGPPEYFSVFLHVSDVKRGEYTGTEGQ